jgi:hypothetical protein
MTTYQAEILITLTLAQIFVLFWVGWLLSRLLRVLSNGQRVITRAIYENGGNGNGYGRMDFSSAPRFSSPLA